MAIVATAKKMYVFHQYDVGDPAKYESFNTTLGTDIQSDTAQAVTTWARNFITSISENSYGYTRIEETISIGEILAD